MNKPLILFCIQYKDRGSFSKWCVQFGPGTYREKNFKQLYERLSPKQAKFDLEEPKEPKPEIVESHWNSP